MAKPQVHNSGWIISVEKISIVVMHETETIETMRLNWWAMRVFHQTSKREHALNGDGGRAQR